MGFSIQADRCSHDSQDFLLRVLGDLIETVPSSHWPPLYTSSYDCFNVAITCSMVTLHLDFDDAVRVETDVHGTGAAKGHLGVALDLVPTRSGIRRLAFPRRLAGR